MKSKKKKTRERIIDETNLERDYKLRGLSQDRIDLVSERLRIDTQILKRVQGSIASLKDSRQGLTLRLNSHLEELSEIEITTGGFVAHTIGLDKKATFSEESKSIKFEPTGNVEIAIANRLNKWKDSSQLTIKKIIAKGSV